jgi:nucleoporin NUP159
VAKLKLLPTPWPNDALPPASATLLSVASRRGLLAAASPNTLVISSTENVRNAFKTKIKAGEPDVINDFKPDSTLEVPQLRHVAFSADEEYLVLNPEGQGILVVYNVDDLLKGSTKPAEQITIHNDSVRALLPNPDPGFAHYMVVIGDSGRLDIVDITKSNKVTVDTEGKKVTCGAWSVRGRAYVVGFEDGTAAAYKTTETLLGKIPRPPDVDESYSGRYFTPFLHVKLVTNRHSDQHLLPQQRRFLPHTFSSGYRRRR